MSDIAEMENKRKAGREDCGSPETLEPAGLEKNNQHSGASYFLTPPRQAVNREIVSTFSKISFSKVQMSA